MTDKPEYIEFFLDAVDTDPVQYKPYSPHFSPCAAVVIRVPIDSDLIEEVDPLEGDCGVIYLGPAGFRALLVSFADMVQTAHREFQDSQQRSYNQPTRKTTRYEQ
jgi:hypothetical protein